MSALRTARSLLLALTMSSLVISSALAAQPGPGTAAPRSLGQRVRSAVTQAQIGFKVWRIEHAIRKTLGDRPGAASLRALLLWKAEDVGKNARRLAAEGKPFTLRTGIYRGPFYWKAMPTRFLQLTTSAKGLPATTTVFAHPLKDGTMIESSAIQK